MKTKIFSGALSILVVTLLLLINYYQERQADLVIESNNLYSKNNHTYQLNILQEEKNNLELKKATYRLFYNIPNNLNLDIRAVHGGNYQDWIFPVYQGQFFSANNSKQAIVGKKVPLKKKQGKNYFSFDEEEYEIIGYLGKYSEYLFNHTVLLNDDRYFLDGKQEYTLDIKNKSLADLNLKKQKLDQSNSGMNRLLTIDFFSPLIVLFTKVVILGILLLLAYYFNWATKQKLLVLEMIGYSKKKLILKNSLPLIIIFSFTSFLGYFIQVGLTIQGSTIHYLIEAGIYIIYLIICYFVTSCWIHRKEILA